MKKKLIISSSTAISGAEIVLKNHIINSRHRFVLVIPNNKEVIKFFDGMKNIERIYIFNGGMYNHKNKFVSRINNLYQIIKEAKFINKLIDNYELNDIDLIYASNSCSCLGISLLNKVKKINLPIVLHIHDMMSACSFTPILKVLSSKLQTLTVSEACKDELINLANFKESNISVIYNGIDNDQFDLKDECNEQDNNELIIGYAGNLIERKGVIYLAEAFKKLKNINYKKKLVISYHLYEEEYMNRIKSILNGLPVEFKSFTSDKMQEFYHSIDILVVPSIKDPLPTTVLEGMACGLIVIGSNIDGIPEMLSSDYLFDVKSSDSIVNKIIEIESDLLNRKKLCRINNPNKIKNKFSIKVKNEKLDLYLENKSLTIERKGKIWSI